MEPIHVLGAGSMGLLMAASIRVAFPSYPIRLLLRDNNNRRSLSSSSSPNGKLDVLVNLIQNRRLRTVKVPAQIIRSNGNSGTIESNKFDAAATATSASEALPQERKFRNVLVTTKAYQAVDALESIRDCLQFNSNTTDDSTTTPTTTNNNTTTTEPATQIVLLCNGAMAARDDILSHFPELNGANLHMALTTHGAYREMADPENEETASSSSSSSSITTTTPSIMMDVIHAGRGHICFPPALRPWVDIFDRAGLQAGVLTESEMQHQLWCKLAANCLINPLTALHQCTNGQVVHIPQWEDWWRTIPEEVAHVAARVGQNEANACETLDVAVLRQFCQDVITATKDNRSSMLQDIKAGRRTEIDALNGYIVRRGDELGVNVPANRQLYEQILALERSNYGTTSTS